MNSTDLLAPLGRLYGAATDARRMLYRRGWLVSYDLGAPTISVGNITTGGTGKTPLVRLVAEILARNGAKACILTRGYGRENPQERVLVSDGERVLADARGAGDEPFDLAKKLVGKAVVIADARRAEAGLWAREKFGVTAFILDDGFQHLAVKRDLDIVLLDATNPFGNGKLLPAGSLRESAESLQRAAVVVISRANLVEKNAVENLKSEISKINANCRIFISQNKIAGLTKLRDFSAVVQSGDEPPNEIPNPESRIPNRTAAFCALGNPESFFKQLSAEKFDLAYTKKFPDHHFYAQSEIIKLEKEAIAAGAEVLLTTAKDAVKLAHLRFNLPCCVVESKVVFDDESAFVEILLKTVRQPN